MTNKVKALESKTIFLLIAITFFTIFRIQAQQSLTYPIVDTDQQIFYDTITAISEPAPGDIYYGQDAHYTGYNPNYQDNADGTITDLVTGLMWIKTPDLDGDGDIDYDDKMSYKEAIEAAETFNLAGYTDWRLPSIKEMYSLIVFSGVDPSGYEGTSTEDLIPFINTNYFDFAYGDVSAGERIIDAQMASSTLYVSTTMNGDETMFGVNFADGRIKGYPTGPMPGSREDKQFYIMFVRGNSYGENIFTDNGNGTITDSATGLMWTKDDSGEGMNWIDALAYAENATIAGYDDWRLPNAKELQSILDYTRAPAITNSAAIDPIFNCTSIIDEGGSLDYPFYWTGTTHASWLEDATGKNAAYVCFGEAHGWMEMPPNSGNYQFMDVHGAGAQRSDPKTGNPDDWPYGHGPQGDVIRIFNYVRLVRDINSTTIQENNKSLTPELNIYPNPANTTITLYTKLKNQKNVEIEIRNISGELIYFANEEAFDELGIDISLFTPGLYILSIYSNTSIINKKFIKL